MQQETEIEIAKLIGTMAVCFPSVNISEQTVAVYASMLKDIPLDVLTASVQQCTTESEFFPTIAKLREKALSLTYPAAPEPLEAWSVVMKEIGRTGFYHSPHFDDPIIEKAVDCIGWRNLCSSENQVADRAHFSKIYEGLLRQVENDRRLLPQARRIQQQVRGLISERASEETELIEAGSGASH